MKELFSFLGFHLSFGASDSEELRKAHEEVRDKEAFLRDIISNLPVAVFCKDAQNGYRFILWNEMSEKMFGLTREQILGKNDYEFFPKDQADYFRRMDEKVMSQNSVVDIPEEPIDSKSLGKILLHTLKVPLRDVEGRPKYLLGISENITERKKVEQVKKEFISIVSHELRTPLTSIRGALGLIKGGAAGALPGQAHELVEIAHRNSERLVLLINDILDIEKIEAGKMDFKIKPAQLGPIIEQCVENNLAYADQYKVKFVYDPAAQDWKIDMDSDRLMQVLTNLLSNAAKFSPEGGSVDVAIKKNGAKIRVSVTDHGNGIPEQFREKIFQKFSQADSSDNRQKQGTGLGLSISKVIVEKMGGEIGFTTETGRGTTFFFEFPEWRDIKLKKMVAIPGKHRPRILVCEDDLDVAGLISEILKDAGLDCDLAHTARQAREFLRIKRYNAMTLDLNLPDLNGNDFLSELRSNRQMRSVPVVIVSSQTDADINPPRSESGMFGVVSSVEKPIDHDQFLVAIEQAVKLSLEGKGRILHIEDESDVTSVTSMILQDMGEIVTAATCKDAREKIQNETFDLVILDLQMPDGSGLDLLPILKQQGKKPVPIIVLTALIPPEDLSRKVDAVLLKSKTSNVEIINTIHSLLIKSKEDAKT